MNLGVVGLGLIGGSLAKAWRKAGHCVHGFDVNQASLDAARRDGIIEAETEWRAWLPSVDVVVLATPPAGLANWVETIKAIPRTKALFVVEVSSVKAPGWSKFHDLAPPFYPLSLHPMAGREKTGYGSSDGDLFRGAPCAIVGDDEMGSSTAMVEQWMSVLGTTPVWVGAVQHDEMVAHVSHLPYLLSRTLLTWVTASAPDAMALAGTGFRDVARIGASDLDLWEEIVLGNRQAIARALSGYRQLLDQVHQDLSEGLFPSVLRGTSGFLGDIGDDSSRSCRE